MAPRKGGGSSSWGSSTSLSCPACDEPLYLDGYDWKDTTTTALFAFWIIALIVLVACLVLSTRFKWVRQVGSDKLRRKGYIIAASSAFIFYALSVSNTALYETSTVTKYPYLIINIFFYLTSILYEIITLGIILRTLCEDTRSNSIRRMVGLHVTALAILGILALVVFGITIYETVNQVRYGYFYWSTTEVLLARKYIQLTYQALYFLVALYACSISIYTLVRERIKSTLIMTSVVVPALFLRTLTALINYSIYVNPSIYSWRAYYAYVFTEVLTSMAIFLGLAIIGCLPQSSKVAQQQQQQLNGYNQQFTQQYTQQYTQRTGPHY